MEELNRMKTKVKREFVNFVIAEEITNNVQ